MRTFDPRSITDIHILVSDLNKSLTFPGPHLVNEAAQPIAASILDKANSITRDDFMVDIDGTFWRGRRDRHAVDGTWLRMRRMADKAPELEALPSPIPKQIRDVLLSPNLTRGGLIHVVGGPGCGKTTSGCAILVSRLVKFGGAAYTVEEPPELPLNGFHGTGYCTQSWVAGEGAADWIESMRGALRSQPAGTNLILFVGEVRDAETAQAMLRAASNGFLVISTGFGSDIVTGIDTFFQLLGEQFQLSLAGVLRVVLFQNLAQGRFTTDVLVSESAGSPVAALIRKGSLAQLQDEVQYQRNQMQRGQNFWADK